MFFPKKKNTLLSAAAAVMLGIAAVGCNDDKDDGKKTTSNDPTAAANRQAVTGSAEVNADPGAAVSGDKTASAENAATEQAAATDPQRDPAQSGAAMPSDPASQEMVEGDYAANLVCEWSGDLANSADATEGNAKSRKKLDLRLSATVIKVQGPLQLLNLDYFLKRTSWEEGKRARTSFFAKDQSVGSMAQLSASDLGIGDSNDPAYEKFELRTQEGPVYLALSILPKTLRRSSQGFFIYWMESEDSKPTEIECSLTRAVRALM